VPSSATFEIWAGADDTYIYKNSAGYPPSGSVIRAGTLATAPPEKSNFVTATPYEVACAYLEWDTSSFPNDATITGATLRVDTLTHENFHSPRQVLGEWRLNDDTDANYTPRLTGPTWIQAQGADTKQP
jgi:hypothetical protein